MLSLETGGSVIQTVRNLKQQDSRPLKSQTDLNMSRKNVNDQSSLTSNQNRQSVGSLKSKSTIIKTTKSSRSQTHEEQENHLNQLKNLNINEFEDQVYQMQTQLEIEDEAEAQKLSQKYTFLKDQEKITGKTFVNLIEDQASREFVPVDLLEVLRYIMEKGKKVKQLMIDRDWSDYVLEKMLINNTHFMICFNFHCQKLIKEELLRPDLTGWTEKTVKSLENFITKKLNYYTHSEQLQNDHQEKTRQTKRDLDRQILKLKGIMDQKSNFFLS